MSHEMAWRITESLRLHFIADWVDACETKGKEIVEEPNAEEMQVKF
jgi:hypothetical protein